MPIYEIQAPNGEIFEVDAPNEEAAASAFAAPTPGPVESNMGAKGDMVAGDRVQADFRDRFADGAMFGFAREAMAGLAPARQAVNAIRGGPTGYDDVLTQMQAEYDAREAADYAENPLLAGGVGLAGAVASGIAAPALAPFKGGTLAARAGNNALTGGYLSSIAGLGHAEGGIVERLPEAGMSALTGAGIGGGLTIAGAAMRGGLRKTKDFVQSKAGAVKNPRGEAERRIAASVDNDLGVPGYRQLDEVSATQNQQPVFNADRGGETTRALARSAANRDPNARAILEGETQARFETQADRARTFFERVLGGQADDDAFRQSVLDAARIANKPAYERAMNHPKAQALWDDDFAQLMQAPAVQQAVRETTKVGANRAAAEGFRAVKNPFKEVDGEFVLTKNSDGSTALPNLQFWDEVKRRLYDIGSAAKRKGLENQGRDIDKLRVGLVEKLDNVVPTYATARQGAARFFGEESALDAGRAFDKSTFNLNGSIRAIRSMKPEERDAFQVGFVANLMERIERAGFSQNVIKQVFHNPTSKRKIAAALGPKAREVEAFVETELALDLLRTAVQGNSTTARQLIELGLSSGGVGVADYYYGSGNPLMAAMKGLMAGLIVKGGQKVEARVMKEVGEILTSVDKSTMDDIVKKFAKSNMRRHALEKLVQRLEQIAAPATAVTATTATSQ